MNLLFSFQFWGTYKMAELKEQHVWITVCFKRKMSWKLFKCWQ